MIYFSEKRSKSELKLQTVPTRESLLIKRLQLFPKDNYGFQSGHDMS